jgi:hypothetical protein
LKNRTPPVWSNCGVSGDGVQSLDTHRSVVLYAAGLSQIHYMCSTSYHILLYGGYYGTKLTYSYIHDVQRHRVAKADGQEMIQIQACTTDYDM